MPRDAVPRGLDPSTSLSSPAASTVSDLLHLHERERSRLAFDLHDGPAQAVSAALLQVRLLDCDSPALVREGIENLAQLLGAALDDMYSLIEHLHSRSLDHEDLRAKIAAQVDEFATRSGLPVTLDVLGDGGGYSPSLQIATYRIVQEALNNIRRHAHADSVSVTLRLGPDSVSCAVQDDGRGFDLPALAHEPEGVRARYGLRGMRERAALLGGSCEITSTKGAGTCVRAELPVWRA